MKIQCLSAGIISQVNQSNQSPAKCPISLGTFLKLINQTSHLQNALSEIWDISQINLSNQSPAKCPIRVLGHFYLIKQTSHLQNALSVLGLNIWLLLLNKESKIRWLTFKCKIIKITLVIFLKCMPVTQSILGFFISMFVATTHHLTPPPPTCCTLWASTFFLFMPHQPLVDSKHCVIHGTYTKSAAAELLTVKGIQLLLIFSWGFQPPQKVINLDPVI